MPIAFCRMETVNRTPHRPMREKFDYLSREGRFARRRDLLVGPVTVLPPDAPKRFLEHRVLWQEAERAERARGIMAQELLIALPPAEMLSVPLAKTFCQELADWFAAEYQIGVTFVIHGPDRFSEGESQRDNTISRLEAEHDHAHFLLTSRQITDGKWGRRRHRALLPTMGGRKEPAGFGVATSGRVLDAFNFEALVRSRLDRFLQRCGLPYRTRFAAIHPGYHVGPVAAVGAFINDVEAIGRRPDATAIFRKKRRLYLNSLIEAQNIRAIESVEPLLEHLGDRIFTEQDVRELVSRYVEDKEDVRQIVDTVLLHAHHFHDSSTGLSSPHRVLPAYIEMESAIAELARRILGADHGKTEKANNAGELAAALISGPRLTLVDITTADHAGILDELVDELARQGRPVVMATHLNKRRNPPKGIALRPLHWGQHFRTQPGEMVLVDEADCLKLSHLKLLLSTALEARSRVVLIRRSYRRDTVNRPILTAICERTLTTLGDRPSQLSDLPFELEEGKRVKFVQDVAGQIEIAVLLQQTAQKKGRRLFLLCADPSVAAAIGEQTGHLDCSSYIGPTVPLSHRGPVMVLHSLAGGTALPGLLGANELHFLVPQTIASDLQVFTSQLRVSYGQVTSLRDSTRPAWSVRLPILEHDPLPDLLDYPPDSDPQPDTQMSPIEELRQSVGLELNDVEQALEESEDDDAMPDEDFIDQDELLDDDPEFPDDTS